MKYVITETTACSGYVMSDSLEPVTIDGEDYYCNLQVEEHFNGRVPHKFNSQKEAITYCRAIIKLGIGEGAEIEEYDNKVDDHYQVYGGNGYYYEIVPVPKDTLKYTFYVNPDHNGKILITCRETGMSMEVDNKRHVKGSDSFCMVYGNKEDKHISDKLGVFNLVFRGCKIEGRITYRQDFHTPISFKG